MPNNTEQRYASNLSDFLQMSRQRTRELFEKYFPSWTLANNKPNKIEQGTLPEESIFPYNDRARFGHPPAQPYFQSLMEEPLHMYQNGGDFENLI